MDGEVSRVSKFANRGISEVRCRVDGEVLRDASNDSGVSGCVDADISSANLKEEMAENEAKKSKQNVQNKNLIVAKRRRRRRKIKHDAKIDDALKEKPQTEASHEMDGSSSVTGTVDSMKEVRYMTF